MKRFAEGTSVSSMRTLEQIKRLLVEFGGEDIATAERAGQAAIVFTMAGRRIRFILPLPPMEQFALRVVRGRKVKATPAQALTAWETSCRERWRALLFAIKAKLVSAQAGVETIEQAFLANVMTKTGTTVWDEVVRNVGYLGEAKALAAGRMEDAS